MLSSDSLKEISNIFCGDTAGFYTYKQGYKLVEFFNANFGTKDVYRSGFPSRWAYVHDKLVDLISSRQIDRFFNIVLGKTYLMQEQSLSEVEAAEKIETIYAEFNRIIHRDISANNIFIISGMIKIADFGLGKDLNVFTSHQTMHTNS